MIGPGGGFFSATLIEKLRGANSIALLTGAGASAESGIPTFRDLDGGLWKEFDPAEMATPEAFGRNPRRVWEWYASRRRAALAATPNAAHETIARFEQKFPDVTVITQNVDGLHQRAGSRRVIELHGSLHRARCSRCHRGSPQWDDHAAELPPRCPCGGFLRPDVVWFGESLPERAMSDASRLAARAQVLLVVGTSAVVYPAAGLPVLTLRAGGYVLEVNAEATPLSQAVNESVIGRAGELLPVLWRETWGD